MTGWLIFLHSVRMVLNNLTDALRVSAVLYALPAAQQVLLSRALAEAQETGAAPTTGPSALLALTSFVASLWIAVSWHRFVLEEEYPQGWLPSWHGGRILAYFGRSILVGLVIVLAVVVAMVPVGLAFGVSPALGSVFASGLVGLGAYLFFRFGPVLPAAAIGAPLSLRDSWIATRDRDGGLIVLAFLVFLGSAGLNALNVVFGGIATTPGLVLTVLFGWATTMVGSSVLTTLYGHYVQGRPIT